MKVAFKGFRGFGENVEFIDLENLIILTGKNSSGKSTFIKLLQLLIEGFSGVNNLQDLANIEINIDNDLIGGRENLQNIRKMIEPQWIFSIPVEFYTDYHEFHVRFYMSNFKLHIKSIDIHDRYTLSQNDPYISMYKSFIKVNAPYLLQKYNELALIYNFFEEYRYRTEPADYKGFLDYECKYELQRLEYGYTDDRISKEIESHICAKNNDCFIAYDIGISIRDYSHPFKQDMPGVTGYYLVLDIITEDLLPSEDDIRTFIRLSEYGEELEELINKEVKQDPNYSFYERFRKIINYNLINMHVDYQRFSYTKSYTNIGSDLVLLGIDKQFNAFVDRKEILTRYDDFFDIFVGIIYSKDNILSHLIENTLLIFQKYILKEINPLSSLKIHRNSNLNTERSYNIFNPTNSFSKFLKTWKDNDNEQRRIILKLLRKYLKQLQIADNIKIRLDQNIGFIHLSKNGNNIAIIDEGSGISNILSSILLIVQTISSKESDHTAYIVLEEPETNLHPSLQSLLADVFVDLISRWKTNIIIETHSEYLLRKLQFLIAKKKVNHQAVNLYYFTMSYTESIPQIIIDKIPITKAGMLEKEFGSGFFDEADNIAIELFKIQKKQLN